MKVSLLFVFILFGAYCMGQKATVTSKRSTDKLTVSHQEDFEGEMKNWIVEQMPGGTVEVKNGKMEITDVGGCTIWFDQKLYAPLIIEYDAVVIENAGPQDRVSDLNCFWLATDPQNPDDFFANHSNRTGKFKHYDSLRLYYVGLGGHHNTKTRFRRYAGDGTKPLLPEHDLSAKEYLIKPNEINHIRIMVRDGQVKYYRNNVLIYDFLDANPYTKGYFGIRTVNNHMTVDNFKVYSLKATK